MTSKEGLLFGTAGIPRSSKALTTQSGIERIHELELGCMEVEFVQGVKMGPQTARDVGNVAARRAIRLSAHAPYFVNLNAQELDKMAASQERIIQTARVTALFGGEFTCRTIQREEHVGAGFIAGIPYGLNDRIQCLLMRAILAKHGRESAFIADCRAQSFFMQNAL